MKKYKYAEIFTVEDFLECDTIFTSEYTIVYGENLNNNKYYAYCYDFITEKLIAIIEYWKGRASKPYRKKENEKIT